MSRLPVWLLAWLLLALPVPGSAQMLFTPRDRSTSASRQFVIYCTDPNLRFAVASYVETAKDHLLSTLGLQDQWRIPIVVSLIPPRSTQTEARLSDVRFVHTDGGPKIDITVMLRQEEFREARFPQQVMRALLLELMYRTNPPPPNTRFHDAPGWLVEGLTERMQIRASGMAPYASVFRQMINTGRIPPIRDFLNSSVESMDSTSRALHAICSANLIDMLLSFPDGKASLARMIRKIGESDNRQVNLLLKYFPEFEGNETSLERWWTVGLAKGSASDRYLTLDIPQSDDLIDPALEFQLPVLPSGKDKKKAKQQKSEKPEMATYTLADFATFKNHPQLKETLDRQFVALSEIGTKVHPLLRPVVNEYLRINRMVARGKTRSVPNAIQEIETYRRMIVQQMANITDYLNWYEATQINTWSGAFDNYLRTARAVSTAPPRRSDPIARYIDQVELEFE